MYVELECSHVPIHKLSPHIQPILHTSMTSSVDKKSEVDVNRTEDHLAFDVEDNEDGEDEVGGEAAGAGKLQLIHIQIILSLRHNVSRRGEEEEEEEEIKEEEVRAERPSSDWLVEILSGRDLSRGRDPTLQRRVRILGLTVRLIIKLRGLVMHGGQRRKKSATRRSWRTKILKRRTKISGEGRRYIGSSESMHGNTFGLE